MTFAAIVLLMLATTRVSGHQVPFSYIDAHIASKALDVTLVVHMVDVAHELDIEPPERLLDSTYLESQRDRITAMLEPRMHLAADGERLPPPVWSDLEPIPDRQSLRIRARYALAGPPGRVALDAQMFPYDPPHQSFINFYDADELRHQVILDQVKTHADYFTATKQGAAAVVRQFATDGVRHMLLGPDHLLFLFGLLLLGGSLRQLVLIVTAFTAGHAASLALAAFNYVAPPARLVEPAVALTIVYLGADNLMVRDGRDMRLWIALAFGVLHGFGFASILRDTDLPRLALGWSLISFNLGVEFGQLLLVIVVASALAGVRARHAAAGKHLVFAGSIVVIVAGTFWFVQRVFFPGGMA